MANINTFLNSKTPFAAQSITSTSETQLSSGTAAITLVFPNNYSTTGGAVDRKAFKVRAAGRMTTDATGTVNIKLYSGVAGAQTTNIAATGASNSLASTSSNFYLEALCFWDSTSKIMNGIQAGWSGTTVVSDTALTNPSPAQTSLDGYGFTLTATFSAVTTAGTIQLTDFSIDDV